MKEIAIPVIVIALVVVLFIAINKELNLTGQHIKTSGGAINNVGNIRKSTVAYVGEIDSPSTSFKSFKTVEYGFRAIYVILHSYYTHGFNTLRKMMNRYAPESDNNNTTAYIAYLSDNTGINADHDMSDVFNTDKMKSLLYYIAKFEQGSTLTVSVEQAQSGINLA